MTILLASALVSAASASADVSGVSVTGDDGVAVAVSPGLTIRHMRPEVTATIVPGSKGRHSLSVVGPNGATAASESCTSDQHPASETVDYTGNGVYTVNVVWYPAGTDFECKTPPSGSGAYQFTVNAGPVIGTVQPQYLLRTAGASSTQPVMIPVQPSPGALSTNTYYGLGAKVDPATGAIITATDQAWVDDVSGAVRFNVSKAGFYTAVTQDTSFNSGFNSPFSPPYRFKVVEPFDFTSISLSDSIGPIYKVTGYLRTEAATGARVRLAIRKGKRGRYRSLGTARIRSDRTFRKIFSRGRTGSYTLRIRFKGTQLVLPGTGYMKLRLKRL